MKNRRISNLEWFENIRILNDEEGKFEEIPDNEKVLYKKDFLGRVEYNWDKIYDLLFDEEIDDELIATKNAIPKGIKELFEIDEEGKPTGNFDWEYAKTIIESISGANIFEMKNSEYPDELNELLVYMPHHMGNILSNIDNPIELYEALIANPDLNCPKEIRENPEIMYKLFELSDFEDVDQCFDLMSDKLKKDEKFLAKVFDLQNVKENKGAALLNINSELYANDDAAKKQIIECWGLAVFEAWWKETSHLWESSMETMDDQLFYNSLEDIDLVEMKSKDSSLYNPELVKKINDEICRRSKNEMILSIMKKALGKAVGKTGIAETELNVDEICKICEEEEEYENY